MRLETDNQVRAAKCDDGKSYTDFPCGNNLQLRVYPSRKKTFRSRLKRDGKVSAFNIGHYPELTLSKARRLHEAARDYFKQGYSIDRIKDELAGTTDLAAAQRGIDKPSPPKTNKQTFKEFAEIWWEIKVRNKAWKTQKVADQNWQYLENHAFPVLGNRPVTDISTVEVIEMLTKNNKWWDMYPTMKKVRGNTTQIFALAKSTKYKIRPDNPADIDLDAEGIKVEWAEQPRGYFDPERAPEFFQKIANSKNIHQQCLKLLLATGARPENAVEAEWSEFNLDTEEWIIPKEKMKGTVKEQRRHVCWISPIVRQVLEQQKAAGCGDGRFVFPSDTKTGHIEHNSPARTLKRVIGKENLEEWRGVDSTATPTAHGVRHTFKTWAMKRGYSDELSEAQSGRFRRNVGARYDHNYSADPRIEMMAEWDNYLRNGDDNG